MGGRGSGRQPWRASVYESRELEIGELTDGGRLASQPRGEIRWVEGRSGEMRGCLSYAISRGCRAGKARTCLLALRYRQTSGSPERRECLLLVCGAGGRWVAECPRCRRPVRQLYCPPSAHYFLCRGCYGLVYRRPLETEALAEARAAMGSLLDGLYQLPGSPQRRSAAAKRRAREALLRMLADELPLSVQETRIYCLRLGKLSLSLRQIAALVGCSKSSVARYLAAGLAGVDIDALLGERLWRRSDRLSWAPLSADLGDLRRRLRLIRGVRPRRSSSFAFAGEIRELSAADADEAPSSAGEGSI